ILAACDEALAEGELPPLAADGELTATQSRLIKGLECVRLMRGVWKRPHSTRFDGNSRAEPDIPPRTELGRVTILRELGRGGFGIVYLAFDPSVARLIAVKVPRPDLHLTPDLRERFRHEARSAGRLDHPNIIPVFESGDIDNVTYLATAYCPGV